MPHFVVAPGVQPPPVLAGAGELSGVDPVPDSLAADGAHLLDLPRRNPWPLHDGIHNAGHMVFGVTGEQGLDGRDDVGGGLHFFFLQSFG